MPGGRLLAPRAQAPREETRRFCANDAGEGPATRQDDYDVFRAGARVKSTRWQRTRAARAEYARTRAASEAPQEVEKVGRRNERRYAAAPAPR